MAQTDPKLIGGLPKPYWTIDFEFFSQTRLTMKKRSMCMKINQLNWITIYAVRDNSIVINVTWSNMYELETEYEQLKKKKNSSHSWETLLFFIIG